MRKKLTKIDYIIIVVLAIIISIIGFSYFNDSSDNYVQKQNIDDFDTATIGILTGSTFEEFAIKNFPNAKREYFKNYSDMILSVTTGKIDGFFCEKILTEIQMKTNENLGYIADAVDGADVCAAFCKNERSDKLREQFNTYLNKIKQNGEYDELKDQWENHFDEIEPFDYKQLQGEDTIRLATDAELEPFEFYKDNIISGLSINLVENFCMEYGYALEIYDMTFESIIASLTSEKYDMAVASIAPTEERAQSVNFSDPYYYNEIIMAIRIDGNNVGKTSIFESIKDSFNRNFITEDRYKLVLNGILTTIIITFFSIIFGSILAFLICLFRRSNSYLAPIICDTYVKILQGTPIVVVLMIFYYIIFGKTGLSGTLIAIIAFSLNEAAFISETMRSGIDSIDIGQKEAALVLGFSEKQAFFKYIFPQAAKVIVPSYKNELVSTLKGTSIVGYIAVQDITKAGDIIRSRTYEAFFPLIVTAIIYFALCWLLTKIVEIIASKIFKN